MLVPANMPQVQADWVNNQGIKFFTDHETNVVLKLKGVLPISEYPVLKISIDTVGERFSAELGIPKGVTSNGLLDSIQSLSHFAIYDTDQYGTITETVTSCKIMHISAWDIENTGSWSGVLKLNIEGIYTWQNN